MAASVASQPFPIIRFCRQYLQLEPYLSYPDGVLLRAASAQEFLYEQLFSPDALTHPPPPRYQLRTLKTLVARIENAIEDWDQDGISDDLMAAVSRLLPLVPPPGIAPAILDEKSYVTYHQSLLGSDSPLSAPSITLIESRSLISAAGTTGLRTWEASLHLGRYLCSSPDLVRNKHVVELGAGTGYLSVLCAKHLAARHVVVSDGSDRVVDNLPDNFAINGLQSPGDITSVLLEWGHEPLPAEIVPRDQCSDAEGADPAVDLVLGADITYDKTLAPPLVATLESLATRFPRADILLSATQRNEDTFQHFLTTCRQAGFHVSVVDFAIPPAEQQAGPFYDSHTPIHICRIATGQRQSARGEG